MSPDLQLIVAYLVWWAVMAFLALVGVHRMITPVIKRKNLRPLGVKRVGVIFIREDLTGEQRNQTLNHEYQHTKQAWLLPPFLWSMLYMLVPACQRWFEADAYAASVRAGRRTHDAARALAHNHYPGGATDQNVAAATRAILKRV